MTYSVSSFRAVVHEIYQAIERSGVVLTPLERQTLQIAVSLLHPSAPEEMSEDVTSLSSRVQFHQSLHPVLQLLARLQQHLEELERAPPTDGSSDAVDRLKQFIADLVEQIARFSSSSDSIVDHSGQGTEVPPNQAKEKQSDPSNTNATSTSNEKSFVDIPRPKSTELLSGKQDHSPKEVATDHQGEERLPLQMSMGKLHSLLGQEAPSTARAFYGEKLIGFNQNATSVGTFASQRLPSMTSGLPAVPHQNGSYFTFSARHTASTQMPLPLKDGLKGSLAGEKNSQAQLSAMLLFIRERMQRLQHIMSSAHLSTDSRSLIGKAQGRLFQYLERILRALQESHGKGSLTSLELDLSDLENLEEIFQILEREVAVSQGRETSSEKAYVGFSQDRANLAALRNLQKKGLEEGMVTGTKLDQSQRNSTQIMGAHLSSRFSTEAFKPFASLQLLVPRTLQELVAAIQTHVTKYPGIPLTLMLPYPVAAQVQDHVDNVGEGQATSGEKRSKEKGSRRAGGGTMGSQPMVLVPAGPVLIENPDKGCGVEQLDQFLIGAVCITNAQFAGWLTDQLITKQIEIRHPGMVYDREGHLLARTAEAVPTSQIELHIENGLLEFRATPTKEQHPVVHVSWYGAMAFCRSNGFFLPTEMQWERAAGMPPTTYGQAIKKLQYAFDAEQIDRSLANYRVVGRKNSRENYSMPVGFFDGETVFTLEGQRIETSRAISPWGCFDMSGNVREWVSDDHDQSGLYKTSKGGGYLDSPEYLEVSASIPLSPESTDASTGFRVCFQWN